MRNHSGIVVNVEVLAADYRRRIHAARDALGSPAQLDEALIATGIDCFITLLDGGTAI